MKNSQNKLNTISLFKLFSMLVHVGTILLHLFFGVLIFFSAYRWGFPLLIQTLIFSSFLVLFRISWKLKESHLHYSWLIILCSTLLNFIALFMLGAKHVDLSWNYG